MSELRSHNLIGDDIILMRRRYDDALDMQGISAKYQFPNIPDTNAQGEALIDSYSDYIDTRIFFDGNPKVKTLRRYGWVVENSEDLPFLIHCSFNLPNLQRDSLFTFSGQYTGLDNRIFRVTDLTYDIQCADHIVCRVIPVYDKSTLVGRTKKEIAKTFNKSNHFLKNPVDYRGHYHVTKEDLNGEEVDEV